jgi:hypothetical protein
MLLISSTPVLIRRLWQLKTGVFLHWFPIRAALLFTFSKHPALLPSLHDVYEEHFDKSQNKNVYSLPKCFISSNQMDIQLWLSKKWIYVI